MADAEYGFSSTLQLLQFQQRASPGGRDLPDLGKERHSASARVLDRLEG